MQIIYTCNKISKSENPEYDRLQLFKSFTVIAALSLTRRHDVLLAADEKEEQCMQMLLTFSFSALPVV